MTVAEPHHWTDLAACAGMPTRLWFPEPGDSTKEALAICSTCAVRAECLQYALDNGERFGLYGGTTAKERKTLRRGRVQRHRQVTHGTPSGYAWHLNRHEAPCWYCADANSRYQETTSQLRKEGRA